MNTKSLPIGTTRMDLTIVKVDKAFLISITKALLRSWIACSIIGMIEYTSMFIDRGQHAVSMPMHESEDFFMVTIFSFPLIVAVVLSTIIWHVTQNKYSALRGFIYTSILVYLLPILSITVYEGSPELRWIPFLIGPIIVYATLTIIPLKKWSYIIVFLITIPYILLLWINSMLSFLLWGSAFFMLASYAYLLESLYFLFVNT